MHTYTHGQTRDTSEHARDKQNTARGTRQQNSTTYTNQRRLSLVAQDPRPESGVGNSTALGSFTVASHTQRLTSRLARKQ